MSIFYLVTIEGMVEYQVEVRIRLFPNPNPFYDPLIFLLVDYKYPLPPDRMSCQQFTSRERTLGID